MAIFAWARRPGAAIKSRAWLPVFLSSAIVQLAPTGSALVAREPASLDEGQRPTFELAGFSSPRTAPAWHASTEDAARPGLVERIRGIARGRMQVEGGYSFLHDEAQGVRTTEHAVPDLLVRYGLAERLELRVGWPGYVATKVRGAGRDDSHGDTLDPNVGFMFDLCPQRGLRPQTALSVAVPITLRGNPFSLNGLQPLAQLLYRWTLTERLALGGTTGMALFEVGGDDFVELQQTASVDYLLTRRLGGFAQWEMLVDHGSADDASQHMLAAGFSLLVTERLQLSWQGGFGANRAAPDLVTDVRFAYRF